jgi:hypothetical protein
MPVVLKKAAKTSYHYHLSCRGLPHLHVHQAVLHDDLGFASDQHGTPKPNELAVGHCHLQHWQVRQRTGMSAEQQLLD